MYAPCRLWLFIATVPFLVRCAKAKKSKGKFRMRDTVKIGHRAQVTLPSEGNRTVEVVTVSDAAAGIRAFTVDDLLSEEECKAIISSGYTWDKSGVSDQFDNRLEDAMSRKDEAQLREMFDQLDQDEDDLLDRSEVAFTLQIFAGLVTYNHTELLLRYGLKKDAASEQYKVSFSEFVSIDWRAYRMDMRKNQPYRFNRHSETSWLEYSQHPQLRKILDKVSAVLGLPTSLVHKHKEAAMQLVYYEPGGAHYSCHHDTARPQQGMAGDFRFLTFFLFLSDVSEGGETVLFGTDVNGSHPERHEWTSHDWIRLENSCQLVESCPKHPGGSSPEAFRGAAVIKPKRGRAVFWYNVEVDSKGRGKKWVGSSLHGGCPTLKEPKYAANVWLRAGPYLKQSITAAQV